MEYSRLRLGLGLNFCFVVQRAQIFPIVNAKRVPVCPIKVQRVTADGLNVLQRGEFAGRVARRGGNLVWRIRFDQIVNPRAAFRARARAAQGVESVHAGHAVVPIDLQKALREVGDNAGRFQRNGRAHLEYSCSCNSSMRCSRSSMRSSS